MNKFYLKEEVFKNHINQNRPLIIHSIKVFEKHRKIGRVLQTLQTLQKKQKKKHVRICTYFFIF